MPAAPPKSLEVVHPVWLLKAIGITILGALVCGYITLCLLFYQGQWQLILHPQRTGRPLSSFAGLPAIPIRFDASESGVPRLSGALIAADASSRYAPYTVLYLRGGDSSLARSPTDAATLATLHGLGLQLFAFDYRGYGDSDPTHPNQSRMIEDANAALRYLREARHLADEHILLYGNGVGASLAAGLAAANPKLAALILDSPGPAPLSTALADPRIRSLPVRALFHENFSLAALTALSTPKLLISYPTPALPPPEAFRQAAEPKITLELSNTDPATLTPAITRFLDQYLHG